MRLARGLNIPSEQDRRRARRRRRKPRRPHQHRRLAQVGALVAVAVVVGVIGAVLVRDILDVDRQLQAAQRSFEQARDALSTGDIDGSSASLQAARRHLGDARSRSNRLVWRFAERVPVGGNSLRSVSAMVGVADETSRLGRLVVEGARDLIGDDGRLEIQTRDGAIPLAPFVEAADALGNADTRTLRAELDRLRAVPQLLVPGRVAGARERALASGIEVATTLDAARDLMAAVPTLLGADGPRRYFLAMENPAELRGTGGLVGFFATVDVADGRMRLSQPASYEALDAQEPEDAVDADLDPPQDDTADPDAAGDDRPPGPGDPFGSEQLDASVSDEFAARYGGTAAARFFGNVNVHPDLPTTASIMADLYRIRTGQSVDGVISINPIGLAILLQATGDVVLPDDVAATAPDLPNPVPIARVPAITMFDLYEVFQGRNAQRRDWLREFATSAFDTVFDARWDGVEMARQVGTAIGAGHLAIHVQDAPVQAALEALDAAGSLAPPDPRRDHMAITGNNAAGNKLDFHMGHRFTGTIWLSGDRDLTRLSRTVDLQVEVIHQFDPTGHSNYVAGSFSPGAFLDPPASRGPFGLNRTWFSTWIPGQAIVYLDGQAVTSPRFGDHTVVDRTVEATFGQTASFEVRATGSAPIIAEGDRRRYILEWRRQPKAIPDRLDLAIEPPAGWHIVAIGVRGGGAGSGSGPFGAAGPTVAVSVDDDGTVRVSGDASTSVVVDVELVATPRPLIDWILPR